MQAAGTARRFSPEHIAGAALAALLLAGLVVAAVLLGLDDRLPVIGGSDSSSVTVPQITSDDLYALEGAMAREQIAPSNRTPQMTSDEAWVLEQAALAKQRQQNGTIGRDMDGDCADNTMRSRVVPPDITSLNLDRDGADLMTPQHVAPDITQRNLDRDGADVP